MKRSGFARKVYVPPPAAPARPLVRTPDYGGTVVALPKPVPWRRPSLLEVARDKPCLLLVPACCNHRTDTTVACHSNLAEHGKAKGRKADDLFSVWGCAPCHHWLDAGSAEYEVKRRRFLEAFARQIIAWQILVRDRAPGWLPAKLALDELERRGQLEVQW